MNKAIITLIFSLIVNFSVAQSNPFTEIRRLYFEELNTDGGAGRLIAAVNRMNLNKDPLGMAYLGAAYSASAGEERTPFGKLKKFNKGKDLIEEAVLLKPLDVEIRFLRMATQIMSPTFLGYNGDIENDKKLILLTFNLIDSNHPNSYFYKHICSFMLKNSKLTDVERAKVKDLQMKLLKK